jgi:hypothetical protein
MLSGSLTTMAWRVCRDGRVAANTLSKPRTAGKGWSFSLGLSVRLTNLFTTKMLQTFTDTSLVVLWASSGPDRVNMPTTCRRTSCLNHSLCPSEMSFRRRGPAAHTFVPSLKTMRIYFCCFLSILFKIPDLQRSSFIILIGSFVMFDKWNVSIL